MPSDTMGGQKPLLPDPTDLTHLLSRNALNRQPSSIKDFYKYFSIPGIGQLAGGILASIRVQNMRSPNNTVH